MEVLLRNIGLVTVITALLVLIKRKYNRIYLEQEGCYEDYAVYKAADRFAGGASVEEVKNMLAACFEFDAGGTEAVLAEALPHRHEQDGGYRAFIHAVNKVLGDEIYRS
jgi:hypothetical protein